MSILDDAYEALATYTPVDPNKPLLFFGAVIERSYDDPERWAYEEILHRFNSMLIRYGRRGSLVDRGLAIHDKRSIERDVQGWTDRWRNVTGRIGQLTHLADVPLFADSKVSRLIQSADLVSWALWRYYALAFSDRHWVDKLWPGFDGADGVMHGLTHLSPSFKAGTCGCPPCSSRLWTPLPPAPPDQPAPP